MYERKYDFEIPLEFYSEKILQLVMRFDTIIERECPNLNKSLPDYVILYYRQILMLSYNILDTSIYMSKKRKEDLEQNIDHQTTIYFFIRPLIEKLLNIIFVAENQIERVTWYIHRGIESMEEDYLRDKTIYESVQPDRLKAKRNSITKLRKDLDTEIRNLNLNNAKFISEINKKWELPTQVLKKSKDATKKTQKFYMERERLARYEFIIAQFYKPYCEVAHLKLKELIAQSMRLLAKKISNEKFPRYPTDANENIHHIGVLVLGIISELNVLCESKEINTKLIEYWNTIIPNDAMFKPMFHNHYKKLLNIQ